MAEAGGSSPSGPYPPGVETDEQRAEYDKLRRRVLWKMPTGLYVIGSRGTDPAGQNLMTANWAIVLPGEHVGFDVDDEGWPTDLGTDTVWRSRRAVTPVRADPLNPTTLPEALVKSGLPSSEIALES
jgi:hypothetical protein